MVKKFDPKYFESKKLWSEKNLGSKQVLVLKLLGQSKCWNQKSLGQTKLWSKINLVKKIVVQKNFGPQNIGSKKFGQNQVSSS